MGKTFAIIITVFLLIVVAIGIFFVLKQEPSSVVNVPAEVDDSGSTLSGVKTIVNANNNFALNLYSKYKDEKEGNIFFSPYSISSALAMTYEGARGKTAEEMRDVFYFPEDDNIRRNNFAKIYNDINKKNKEYKLNTANALWAQEDYKFLDEYFNTVEEYYGGKVTNMDFRTESEKSIVTINNWVEDKTNDKIKDLIPQGMIDSATRLVLTNAIYFKGDWVYQFDKKDTRERDFKVSEDNVVKVPMMFLENDEAKFNYTETKDMQILEMPYEGDDLSMLVLLPKDDLKSIEDSLTLEKLDEYKNMLTKEEVMIHLPKFTFETKYFMAQDLAEMGMPSAFLDADFSGMTGKKDLFISNVIHQAFVDVNEEGTEAAAATAVIMRETAAMPGNIFKADHPFIFVIQEKETGNILFMGRVIDPR